MQWTYKLGEIHEIATAFWKSIGNATVLAFHGKMGAGKTTFIHALCDVKKISGVAGSPTYSIINEYAFEQDGDQKKIYHIDLYRLKDGEEALQAGVEDTLYSGEVCFVEWPEKAPELLPDASLHIHIEAIDNETRRLKIGEK